MKRQACEGLEDGMARWLFQEVVKRMVVYVIRNWLLWTTYLYRSPTAPLILAHPHLGSQSP